MNHSFFAKYIGYFLLFLLFSSCGKKSSKHSSLKKDGRARPTTEVLVALSAAAKRGAEVQARAEDSAATQKDIDKQNKELAELYATSRRSSEGKDSAGGHEIEDSTESSPQPQLEDAAQNSVISCFFGKNYSSSDPPEHSDVVNNLRLSMTLASDRPTKHYLGVRRSIGGDIDDVPVTMTPTSVTVYLWRGWPEGTPSTVKNIDPKDSSLDSYRLAEITKHLTWPPSSGALELDLSADLASSSIRSAEVKDISFGWVFNIVADRSVKVDGVEKSWKNNVYHGSQKGSSEASKYVNKWFNNTFKDEDNGGSIKISINGFSVPYKIYGKSFNFAMDVLNTENILTAPHTDLSGSKVYHNWTENWIRSSDGQIEEQNKLVLSDQISAHKEHCDSLKKI